MSGAFGAFVYGCLGGGLAFLVPNLAYLASWSMAAKKGCPDRFKVLSTYLLLFGGVVVSGAVSFAQGEAIHGHPGLAIQIGLVAPAIVSSGAHAFKDPNPGSVS